MQTTQKFFADTWEETTSEKAVYLINLTHNSEGIVIRSEVAFKQNTSTEVKFNPNHDPSTGQFSTGTGTGTLTPSQGTTETSHKVYREGTMTKEETQAYQTQIRKNWEGINRKLIAENVLMDKNFCDIHTLETANGELKGLSAISEWKDSLYVEFLATKEKGYGKQLIQKAVDSAAEKNKGLELTSISTAIPFYEKLGMHKNVKDNGVIKFSWSAEECKQLRSKDLTDEDLSEFEPEDGVFCVKERGFEGPTEVKFNPNHDPDSGRFSTGTGLMQRTFNSEQLSEAERTSIEFWSGQGYGMMKKFWDYPESEPMEIRDLTVSPEQIRGSVNTMKSIFSETEGNYSGDAFRGLSWFKNFTPHTGEMQLLQQQFDTLFSAKEGDTFSLGNTPQSFTTERERAEVWAGAGYATKKSITLYMQKGMYKTKGYDISKASTIPGEKEVVFPPNIKVRVSRRVFDDETDTLRLYLQEI